MYIYIYALTLLFTNRTRVFTHHIVYCSFLLQYVVRTVYGVPVRHDTYVVQKVGTYDCERDTMHRNDDPQANVLFDHQSRELFLKS